MKSAVPREPRKVTIIPATPKSIEPGKSSHQKLRVAAYCRVSTDSEEQINSYKNQLAYYTEKINSKTEWKFAGVYADEGITGTSMKHREDFKRMLRACREGRIDLILCKSVSRFGRNSVDVLRTIRTLRERNIGVLFEKEGVDTRTMNSELILAFHSAFSQSESESISGNVRWGLRKAYENGTIQIGPNLYGFRREKDGPVLVDEEKAAVIRQIAQWFLDGDSLHTIADKLAQRHILSPKGKETWSTATLRSLLTNEKYKGDALLQKTYRPSLFSDRAVQNDGDLPKYYVEGVLPRILEPEMFDHIQEELAKRSAKRPTSEKAKTPFGRYSGKYALSTLVVCGKCGALYRRVTWYRKGEKQIMWRCGTRLDGKANCPDSPTLEENKLQSAVMEAISKQYIHKDNALEVTMQSIRSVLTPETADSEYAIRTKINDLQKERKTLLATALAENDDGKYDFQFARIKRELEKLQSQLEGVQAVQKNQSVDEARMAEISALLEQFQESGLPFDNVLVRKVVDTVRVESAERLEVTFKDGNRRVVEHPGRN
ncbi:MAG TPA: recombinase family protein [Candidatus Acutalibacter ornithocaccae]|uniref:Recombinase family protein n=1 Tax=Candidatus Acutalibacter ornithocaccae TaxID=2838416 RepID=A0A9D2RZK3_9FIRM|nr:recombinase family protein [Candidatus Acutalibacter ornithocaccae]